MARSKDADIRELQTQYKALSDKIDDVRNDIKVGFKGVYRRQDITNGRVQRNENKIEKIEEDLNKHEKDVLTIENKKINNKDKVVGDRVWQVIMVVLTMVLTFVFTRLAT